MHDVPTTAQDRPAAVQAGPAAGQDPRAAAARDAGGTDVRDPRAAAARDAGGRDVRDPRAAAARDVGGRDVRDPRAAAARVVGGREVQDPRAAAARDVGGTDLRGAGEARSDGAAEAQGQGTVGGHATGGRGTAGRAPELIGRERELAEVAALLEPGRVVTLIGPGGVGKTSLAAACAVTWWVDLAALGDPAAMAPAVAAAVGLVVEGRLGDPLAAWARGADGLLVVDNCEHLLDAVHELLGGMLVEDCPGLRVLATSRERIGLAAERCYVVEPLAGPAAVRLFTLRAAAAGPVEATERVGALCEALDRLPLAIELAAARVGALTVDDLARRLDARLVLLDAGPRGRPARHQTLRAVVDWSWRLLGERERIAFARLHVFAAGIDLDAAEAVIGYGELTAAEVAHVVALLAERSLLTRPGTVGVGRYRMLVSLRVYAAELLDEAGDRELRLRHATYFAGVLEEAAVGLSGPNEAAWVPVIEGALDDARQAWQWSRVHAPAVAVRIAGAAAEFGFWRLRADLLTWSTLILREAGDQAAVLVGAAYGAWLDGDFGTAARIAQGAVDAGHAGAADLLGDIALIQGDLDGAEAHYRQAIAVLPIGTAARAVAMANLALPLAYRQDPAARPAAEAGLVEARATGNPSALAFALFALAEAHGDGDPTAAIGALDEALRLADSVGNRFVAGVTRTAMVALRGRHGPPGPALALFAGAIRHWRTTGGRPLLIIALRNLVVLFARTGRDVAAIELAAALDAPSGVYGAEAERLAQALGAVRVRLPVATAEEAWRRGSTRSADEAAAEALRHLP
ncbi:ATP-binding protein [Dactylosporangium cerinum]